MNSKILAYLCVYIYALGLIDVTMDLLFHAGNICVTYPNTNLKYLSLLS